MSGAFVQAPRHRPLVSPLPGAAVESLATLLPQLPPMGVGAESAEAVTEAWRDRCGVQLCELARFTLFALGGDAPPLSAPVGGRARRATGADRDLLVAWFHDLKAAHPGDPSDLAFVVDDSLGDGAVVVWEDETGPVAMASRTPVVAGMTRMGAVFPPGAAGDAAFTAACAQAAQEAQDVLVLAPAHSSAGGRRYRDLGFSPVLDRVVLGPPAA